jgi:hypothetical protein
MPAAQLPQTLEQLRASGWQSRSVKDEVRGNFLRLLAEGAELFPGIVGYDDTVVPEINIALLAGHDMLFLGEKGQAKSRLMRQLVRFLDEQLPYLDDPAIPFHDDPYRPISRAGKRLVAERAAGEVVHQPARCADDDLRAAAQFGELPFVGIAAVERRHPEARLEPAELAGLGADLHRQFPRRGQDQHLRRPLVRHDPLDRRDAEGRGLAGPGLRLADNVVPRHDRWDRGRLDGRRGREAELLDRLEHGGREAEVRKRRPRVTGRSGAGRRYVGLGIGRTAVH